MVVGGAGKVGSFAVDCLARDPTIGRVLIVDKNEDMGTCLALKSSVNTAFEGSYPDIEFMKMDIANENYSADVINSYAPEIILNVAATFSSFTYVPTLTIRLKERGLQLRCPGHMIAKDLLPIYQLMKTIKRSGKQPLVVNVSFPDVTHPVLAKVGLCPNVGAGEAVLLAEGIRQIVASAKRQIATRRAYSNDYPSCPLRKSASASSLLCAGACWRL